MRNRNYFWRFRFRFLKSYGSDFWQVTVQTKSHGVQTKSHCLENKSRGFLTVSPGVYTTVNLVVSKQKSLMALCCMWIAIEHLKLYFVQPPK
jgi:hypothetical protein